MWLKWYKPESEFSNMQRTLNSQLLKPGITFEHRYTVSDQMLVPALYPEAEEFQLMPKVFATGFMEYLSNTKIIQLNDDYAGAGGKWYSDGNITNLETPTGTNNLTSTLSCPTLCENSWSGLNDEITCSLELSIGVYCWLELVL